MQHLFLAITLVVVIALATCEPSVSKRPLVFHNWPPKSSKQLGQGRNSVNGGKQRTLVVQIRSDQPVPLVLKGRPAQSHAHLHIHPQFHHAANFHSRPLTASRPIKYSAPVYLKGGSLLMKPVYRKPLKIKLPNTKLKSKPSSAYDKPFQYELPATTTTTSYSHVGDIPDIQKLPLETHANFISDHFAPIHTIPAPNLALHDNHIHQNDYRSQQQQQQQEQQHHSQNSYKSNSQYEVTEHQTNDHTIRDPFSGSQKLFAPDPDPSLPTSKLRPALEFYNRPSNGKPLPNDVQTNFLPPVAQPLVQIVGAQQQSQQQSTPEIYPIQFSQPALYVTPHIASAYNPTYLVTQSNNLYTQHQQQQQLFKPAAVVNPLVVEAGYANADLTQEVASNGQILQAAKDSHNNIHPVLDSAPQFAALIAAPVLGEDHQKQQQYAYDIAAPFRLPNVAAAAATAAITGDADGGFVVSNYYGGNNVQDSSQLLQAYVEEEAAHRQQLEAAELQQQLQHEQEEHMLVLQQQQNHLIELQQLQQQHQQHEQQQQQQQQQEEQHQQHLQQQQQQMQLQQQQSQLQQQQQPRQKQKQQQQQSDSTAAAAFEEHQRLVQQQLGDAPLRIFVPDDSDLYAEGTRIQKRSDNLKKGTVEDANENTLSSNEDSFEVSTSVEVSSEDQKGDDDDLEQQQHTKTE